MDNLLLQLDTRIQKLRKQRQLSQEQLGELTNLTKNYVGLLERGKRQPSIKTLAEIARAFGVPLKDLFDFD